MKNPMSSESAASKKAERPSLYDGAASTGHASEVISILDALDASVKKSGMAKWMLGVIVIALLSTALLLYSAKKAGISFARQLELASFIQFFGNKSENELRGEPKAARSLPSMDSAMVSTTTKIDTPQPSQTAVVYSSPSIPSDGEQQGAMVLEASVAESVTKVAGASVAASEPAVTPPAKHSQHESHKRTKPATLESVRQKPSSTDRSSAKPSHATTLHVQGKKNDRDVDLIAALLSHVSVAGSDRREPASVPPRKTNTPSREGLMGPSSRKGGAPDSSRDVVLQSAGDTTGTLINRCQALGFFEGQLCRLRICSGHWGKEPACPVNSPDRSDS